MKHALRITRSLNQFASSLADKVAAFHVRNLGRAVRRADDAFHDARLAELLARDAYDTAIEATDSADDLRIGVALAAQAEAALLGFSL